MNYTDLILKYVSKRIVSYPFPIKGLPKWILSRYRNSNEKIPFIINSTDDILSNEKIMHSRCRELGHFGLYASNYRYVNNDQYYYDLPKENNIIDYIGLIDIDHTRQNIELFKEIMQIIIIPRLPKKGVYCVTSGNGHHVRIVGFKSHAHASEFINSRYAFVNAEERDLKYDLKRGAIDLYTYTLIQRMRECDINIDLLNDVGRVSTVPYSQYKYDKNILCIPFELEDVDKYENSWSDISNPRLPEKLDLWDREISEEVIEFNKSLLESEELANKKCIVRNMTLHPNTDVFPECINNALSFPFNDGMRRMIMFIASFLYTICAKDDDIYNICHQRNSTFGTVLDDNVVDQIISEVIDKGLSCPCCNKIVEINKKKNQYPYLSLGSFHLCRYKNSNQTCLEKINNPVEVYDILLGLSRLLPKKV